MGLFSRREDEIASSTLEAESGTGLSLTPELQVGIAFGVSLLAGFVCAMIVLPLLRPSSVSPPAVSQPQPDFAEPTAREAYVPAVELIRQTDPGAVLTSGAGVWSAYVNTVQMDAGRTGWTFFFYLPGAQEMARVVVDRENVARLEARQSWETPPDVLEDQRWMVDSPSAVAKLQETCGEVIEQQADASIRARLTMAAENRTILWQMSVQSESDPLATCEVTVDAVTGVIR